MLTTTPPLERRSVHLRGWLLVLTLLFAPWVTSHAADEASMPPPQTVGEDVIGTPEPVESRYEYCSSGVLLPNKDNFYSVRDGLLSEYQIEPFKRVRSVALEWEPLRDSGRQNCRIWTTADHSKVILYNDKILLLLDAKTGKLLNSRTFPKEKPVYSAKIEGDWIFILVNSNPYVYPYTPEGLQLWVWDIDSLEQKKSIELDTVIEPSPRFEAPPLMSVYGGRVYLFLGMQFLILSSKDLRLELRTPRAGDVWTSADFNELYFPRLTVIKDVVSNREMDLQIAEGQAVLFDQKTRSFRHVASIGDPNKQSEYFKRLSAKGYRPIARPGNFSRTPKYWGSTGSSINQSSPDLFQYRFTQYPLGEAVMLKYTFKHSGGPQLVDLSLTPGARKYLNMKAEEGMVVPINDATLKFYQSGSSGGLP